LFCGDEGGVGALLNSCGGEADLAQLDRRHFAAALGASEARSRRCRAEDGGLGFGVGLDDRGDCLLHRLLWLASA